MTLVAVVQAIAIMAAGLTPFVVRRRMPALVRVDSNPRRRPTA
jgi:hypothetical protein